MIKITPRNIKEVSAFIRSIPPGIKIQVAKAVATYLIGNEGRGLKHEPGWKFVSRAQAYGKVSDAPAGYFSWKQFRYVAAQTKGFTETYTRTHDIQNGWSLEQNGSAWEIQNKADGVQWVMGHNQATHEIMVGWRYYGAVIASNLRGAFRAGLAEANRWLRQKGR